MDYLPPHRMPRVLRLLAWVFLVIGILGAVANIGLWLAGREFKISRFATSIAWTYSAWRVLGGHRDGVSTLFWIHIIGVGAIAALIVIDSSRLVQLGPGIWVAIGFIVVVTPYLAWARYWLQWDDDHHEPGSYGDWLTNPGSREAAGEWFAMRDAQLTADDVDPPDPDALVEELLTGDDLELTRHRLQHQENRVIPAVCRAIGERRYREDTEAITVLSRLLPNPAPEEAADGLAACCLELEGRDREQAFRDLASTGTARYVDIVLAGLQHEDTRRRTAQGVDAAIAAERRDPEFVKPLTPRLRALAIEEHGDRGAAAAAASALARIDPAFLTSLVRDVDASKSTRVAAILGVAKSGFELPPAELRALWHSARAAQDYAKVANLFPVVRPEEQELLELIPECAAHLEATGADRAYESALTALVASRSSRARDELHRAIALDRQRPSEHAAERLCVMHDLTETPWPQDEQRLTTRARYVSCLRLFDALTCNGGISHAFECLSEADVEVLDPALAEIGPPEVRTLVTRAIRLLSEDSLPPSVEARLDLIAAHFDSVESELDSLDTDYFAINWRMNVKLALYCIRHASEIRPLLTS